MNSPTPPDLRPEQEFEAPGEVLALVFETACALGASRPQALEAARTGKLALDRVEVGLACDDAGQALVAMVEIDPAIADSPERRRAALRLSIDLMALVGAAVARHAGGMRLLARWPLAGLEPPALAERVRELAAIGVALQRPASPAA
jgi:hypothetical protein